MSEATGLHADTLRSMRQQLLIARHYLSLAREAGAETMGIPHESVHREYDVDRDPTDEARRRLLASAHINSAAARLSAISEKLPRASVAYGECRDWFNVKRTKRAVTLNELQARTTEWLHVLLRDDISHAETPVVPAGLVSPKKREEKRRHKLRLHYLRALKISEAYAAIQNIFACMLGEFLALPQISRHRSALD